MGWWKAPLRPGSAFAIATLLCAAATTAVRADSTHSKAVSAGDPYRSCANVGFGAPGESSYVNTEVEPLVAVNPQNDDNRIALWMQDDWSGGLGARGIAGAYSRNGGKGWHEVELPFSRCADHGLNVDRAADPWISIGPDGTAYASAALIGLFPDPTVATTGVAVATSRDGGATWKHVHPLILDSQTTKFYDDKPSVTADPRIPGTAYAVWDRTDCPDNCAVAVNGTFTQPSLFSKTIDYGASWSHPRVIVPTSANHYTIGNVITVNPRDGTLYDVFDYSSAPSFQGFQEIVRSTDGGASWSSPVQIGLADSVGVADPVNGLAVRTGSGIPSAALDPKHGGRLGTLYVTWESSQFSGGLYDEVALGTSTDGGLTWSTQRVNKPSGGPAFTPSVAVEQNGTVGVSYYDFRNLPPSDTTTLPTSAWLTTSPPGGRHFDKEVNLLGRSFDMLQAPNSGGFFLGDYQGLAVADGDFLPMFGAVNDGDTANPTDIFGGSAG